MPIEGQSKNLKELFNEAIAIRDLDVKKISELTDIPVHYLSALSDGEMSKLPAAPYVRGYLLKIAEILKMDSESLLRAYKQEISLWPIKTSGPQDRLPFNRYAFKFFGKKTIFIGGIVLLAAIIFLLWRFDNIFGFFGTPQININNPTTDNLIVNSNNIKLSGKINPSDKLIINNEEVLSDSNGQFEKDFPLQIGINTIEFKVRRFLGKEATIIRQVIYQP